MDMPNGYDMSALCPFCNEVYGASRLFQTNFMCPCCNKKVPKSAIKYAFSELQSFELALALQEEERVKRGR